MESLLLLPLNQHLHEALKYIQILTGLICQICKYLLLQNLPLE